MASLQQRNEQAGVLLMNVGTPAAPTPQALKPYLREFLSDRRVVDYPRWLWLPLLYGIILNTRPRRSARLYENIWTPEGSPLLVIMQKQAAGLARHLAEKAGRHIPVEVGLRYGQPSIATALQNLRTAGATRVLAFPLYPQFSDSTTTTSLEVVFEELGKWTQAHELRTIRNYFTHPGYIQALAGSIRKYWEQHEPPDKLLFSFHGIPQRYARNGDPYPEECKQTAHLVAQALALPADKWHISFQSRFGPEKWLQPYTDKQLEAWGKAGVNSVHVIAPGFSADCLETIDELGREARESFEKAGGGHLGYIPALNDAPEHIALLGDLAFTMMEDWL